MSYPNVNAEPDSHGGTQRLVIDSDVSVMITGEGVEEQGVLLLNVGELPLNLADLIEEYFGYDQDNNPRYYGDLKITIERR